MECFSVSPTICIFIHHQGALASRNTSIASFSFLGSQGSYQQQTSLLEYKQAGGGWKSFPTRSNPINLCNLSTCSTSFNAKWRILVGILMMDFVLKCWIGRTHWSKKAKFPAIQNVSQLNPGKFTTEFPREESAFHFTANKLSIWDGIDVPFKPSQA